MGDSAAEKTKIILDFTNSSSTVYITEKLFLSLSFDYDYDCLLFYGPRSRNFSHRWRRHHCQYKVTFDCKELEKQQEAQRPHCLPESPWPILKDILFMYAFYFLFF
jgi:hypothetical protein